MYYKNGLCVVCGAGLLKRTDSVTARRGFTVLDRIKLRTYVGH